MRIEGPQRYEMVLTPKTFAVTCENGTSKFWGLSTNKLPKLYVVSIDRKPVYVGLTRQSIRSRLRYGWKASGKGGYYGYKWRHKNKKATLHVWCHVDAKKRNPIDIETIEAEVVYLIRKGGQWPAFQTEIHFHESTPAHRKVAADIMRHYQL